MIGEADACRKSSDNNNFHIAKADEDQRLVFGWALVSERTDGETIIDHQGDIVDPDELEKGAYEYVLKFRDAGEEHIGTLRKKAKMVESCVFTPEKMKALGIPEGTVPVGWWIGFHVDDDRTWELIKNGTYNMFSIEGKAVREPVNEPVAKNAYDEWLESNIDNFSGEKDERDFANWKSKHGTPKYATDIDVVDMLYEEYRGNTVAKTFSEVLKFNPYHDKLGRFTSGSGGNYASFTYAPGKSKAHDNAIAREKEKSSKPKEPKPMTEQEYLDSKGVGDASSGWVLDKLRGNRQLGTQRGRERFKREYEKAESEYQKKREQAKQEYREKVKNGELRDKTNIERSLDKAHGHPDNAATQAARRMLTKRGIDWKTGEPLKKSFSFSEVLKFNPYHDRLGRFASSGSATSFTWRPGASAAHDKAIQREKERTSSAGGGGAGGNVISFPGASGGESDKNSNGWDYPGIKQEVDRIEQGVKNIKNHNQASALYRAINEQENVINSAMKDIESGAEKGDVNALLTQRRRLRMSKRKMLQNQVL